MRFNISLLTLFFLSLFFLLNCRQRTTQPEKYFGTGLGGLGAFNHGTLYIQATFSECGEWGGHQEKVSVDIYKDMSLKVHYQVYPYNCDSIQYYYAARNLTPIIDKSTVLRDGGQKAINDYIQELMMM